MRILVTGSRDWTDEWRVYDALAEQYHCHEHEDCGERYVVVEGGASGADCLAAKIATRMGWEVETHTADWTRFGKRAGFIRNSEMVDLGADVCLAFIKNHSRGATMTADLAEKAGIPTLRYEVVEK